MAVIQTIREKYAKLAGFVIALSLVGFILMDAFQSGGRFTSLFGGGTWVAKVGGDKISAEEFDKRASEYETLQGFFSGQQVTSEQRSGIREQVLNSMIYEKQVAKEADRLGLTVSEAEEKALVSGSEPDQAIQQFYQKLTNQQGYDPQFPKQLEREAKKSEGARDAYRIFLVLKEFLVRNKLQQKYDALIGGSIYTARPIAEKEQDDNLTIAGIRYVKVPFTSVPDADVKVTDADLKAFMDKHPAMFRTDAESRSLDYVVFDVVPDREDTLASFGKLRELAPQLAATTNNYENFVQSHSEESYTDTWVTKNAIQSVYADTLMGLSTGSTFGPYFENNTYKITKVADRRTMPDSVKVRHILVKTADSVHPQ
jgi:peptidyl-prolyl cis-trans isomerase D